MSAREDIEDQEIARASAAALQEQKQNPFQGDGPCPIENDHGIAGITVRKISSMNAYPHHIIGGGVNIAFSGNEGMLSKCAEKIESALGGRKNIKSFIPNFGSTTVETGSGATVEICTGYHPGITINSPSGVVTHDLFRTVMGALQEAEALSMDDITKTYSHFGVQPASLKPELPSSQRTKG